MARVMLQSECTLASLWLILACGQSKVDGSEGDGSRGNDGAKGSEKVAMKLKAVTTLRQRGTGGNVDNRLETVSMG